jgi:hypothetical protein
MLRVTVHKEGTRTADTGKDSWTTVPSFDFESLLELCYLFGSAQLVSAAANALLQYVDPAKYLIMVLS